MKRYTIGARIMRYASVEIQAESHQEAMVRAAHTKVEDWQESDLVLPQVTDLCVTSWPEGDKGK